MIHTRPRLRAGLVLGSAAPLLLMTLAAPGAQADEDSRQAHHAEQKAAFASGPSAIAAGSANDLAAALASDSANVTAATFETQPDPASAGVGDSALTGFPTNGDTFAILSTGQVTSVDQPGTFASESLGGAAVRGDTDRDVTILAVDLNVPAEANCLTFDFRFMSEEYPVYVGSSYNDAFIAELDTSSWTTSGSAITAPDNFAFDADGQVVSINSTGIGGMTPEDGAGTAFDGGLDDGDSSGAATTLLSASTAVTPGDHTVYFSLFDQGDSVLDSAVFLDDLVVGYTPDPETDCAPGAVIVTHNLDLSPNTGTGEVGTDHTVTAELTDSAGDPVDETTIEFAVTGAHSTTGTATTDADGNASFTYSGTVGGTDTISGCARPEAGKPCTATDTVSFTWSVDGKAVERIHGPDRYGTAAQISSTWATGPDVAYVASGVNYPDAMPAGALGGLNDAPVLLTRPGGLPAVTQDELERLQPERIVVLGGNQAVSDDVVGQLADYAQADTDDEVSRIAGSDRYDTAAEAALTYPSGVQVAYVATGLDFPDALAAASRAGALDSPVLLTRTDHLPAATAAALEHLDAAEIVVLGGTEAVDDTVLSALEAHTDGTVSRVAGDDRYGTAAAISQAYDPGVNAVFVATGEVYADSMSGAPISVAIGGPIVLTQPDNLPASTIAELERLDPERIIVLGGTVAVSSEVESALAAYFG